MADSPHYSENGILIKTYVSCGGEESQMAVWVQWTHHLSGPGISEGSTDTWGQNSESLHLLEDDSKMDGTKIGCVPNAQC